MSLKVKNMVEALRKHLDSLTEEEKEAIREEWVKDAPPKGWLSIEVHLPMFYAEDIRQGYTIHKVRFEDGKEATSKVADHNTWYYHAKEIGITHWLSE